MDGEKKPIQDNKVTVPPGLVISLSIGILFLIFQRIGCISKDIKNPVFPRAAGEVVK
jgi:hypothetical protein